MVVWADTGSMLASYLVGAPSYPVCSFWDAWCLSAEQYQGSGHTARMLYSDVNNMYEYVPGFGWHGAEPSPYPGDLVWGVNYPCH